MSTASAATAVADEEWVKAAMCDDTIVVELLVRLHGAATATATAAPPPSSKSPVTLPLEWTVRQRRSNCQKNQPQRCSPTTPLSWSSISAGSGGDEPCSRAPPQKPPSIARSKVNGDNEKSGLKRSRKKKTLAELQGEENSLEKENIELKREIADLRVNMEKQRATNESLKRMKVELQTPMMRQDESTAEASTSRQYYNQTSTPATTNNNITRPQLSYPTTSNGFPLANQGTKFTLPDLNVPLEENPCPDAIWNRIDGWSRV